jgi:hypothetical protein
VPTLHTRAPVSAPTLSPGDCRGFLFTQELRQLGDIYRDPPSSLVSGFAAEIDLAGVARMRAQKQKAMVDPITSAIITVSHKAMVRIRYQFS